MKRRQCPKKECRAGWIDCPDCNQKGLILKDPCRKCNGTGVTCKFCEGTKINNPSELLKLCNSIGIFGIFERAYYKKCSRCHGNGQIICPECNGVGLITNKHPCTECEGKGLIIKTLEDYDNVSRSISPISITVCPKCKGKCSE
ncbi:hypothetical protein ACFL2R_00300 [Patescibacteria group bacterium]